MKTLETATYANFATFRKSGAKVATPVWFAPHKQGYAVFSAGDAGKVKRLRNSAQAELAPCTYSGKLLGDWVDAEAFVLEDESECEAARRALVAKYGWMMRMTDFSSRLAGRYHRRAYIYIRVND